MPHERCTCDICGSIVPEEEYREARFSIYGKEFGLRFGLKCCADKPLFAGFAQSSDPLPFYIFTIRQFANFLKNQKAASPALICGICGKPVSKADYRECQVGGSIGSMSFWLRFGKTCCGEKRLFNWCGADGRPATTLTANQVYELSTSKEKGQPQGWPFFHSSSGVTS